MITRILLLACLGLCVGVAAAAEDWLPPHVLPILPVMRTATGSPIVVEGVELELDTKDQVARTALHVQVRNRGPNRAEAVLLLPLPTGAMVRAFGFQGPGGELEARLMPTAEARSIYQSIVNRMRDPALLEFVGSQLLRSSVFPVEPGKVQTVHLSFEQLLPLSDGRITWQLPRAESLVDVATWTVRAHLSASGGVGTVFSPNQDVAETARDAQSVTVRLNGHPTSGSLHLAWTLRERSPMAVWTWPDGEGGGMFAVVAEAPPPGSAKPIPREVTVVLDHSGSMAGEKWLQARRAVEQVIAALGPEESLRLVLFNEGVDAFSPAALPANDANQTAMRNWLRAARPSGGTNLCEAMQAGCAQPPRAGFLPLTLLITDGLPTVGITSERAIRRAVNAEHRLFCVGVGHDVNAPLLDALAEAGHGRTRHLPPGADLEVAVGELVRSLGRPVLATPSLSSDPGRLLDLQPRQMRDAFAGEQILVCGRWAGKDPFTLHLAGTLADGARWQRDVQVDPIHADPLASWVARLWAQRRIAELVQQVRDLGADGGAGGAAARLGELTKDIVRLSTQYGILTEYTAFLATENNVPVPAASTAVMTRASDELRHKAFSTRSGASAQSVALNNARLRDANKAQVSNRLLNADGSTSVIANVRQVASGSLWQRQGRWIESGADGTPTRTIAFGSAEHLALAERLATTGRQSLLAQDGDIQLRDGADLVLVQAPH